MGMAATPRKDLLALRELLETGKLAPVIDKTYPLGETARAIRHLMNEHARGKVVITAG
ncbi:MAG: zinc-binding dehydrogenase [Chloroflexi bacterium]|nr:zinc-binding dehydrogenase [Chloroflexota bacterium]